MATKAQQRAYALVAQAIKSGQIPAPTSLPCEVCKARAKEYHHPSGYTGRNALVVAALCKPCHEGAHHNRLVGETRFPKKRRRGVSAVEQFNRIMGIRP